MSQRHPVPRIELVFSTKPTRRRVEEEGRSRWEEGPNPQPWHVRHIGGNGETLSTSEQLTSVDACLTNVRAHAEVYGFPHPDLVTTGTLERGGDIGPSDDSLHVYDLVLTFPDDLAEETVPVLLRVES